MAHDEHSSVSAASTRLSDFEPVPADADYLDLDGDGVPDAVRTTKTVVYSVLGGPDIIESVEEFDRDIGDDGRPRLIEWLDTIAVGADGDGQFDLIDVTALEVRATDNN